VYSALVLLQELRKWKVETADRALLLEEGTSDGSVAWRGGKEGEGAEEGGGVQGGGAPSADILDLASGLNTSEVGSRVNILEPAPGVNSLDVVASGGSRSGDLGVGCNQGQQGEGERATGASTQRHPGPPGGWVWVWVRRGLCVIEGVCVCVYGGCVCLWCLCVCVCVNA